MTRVAAERRPGRQGRARTAVRVRAAAIALCGKPRLVPREIAPTGHIASSDEGGRRRASHPSPRNGLGGMKVPRAFVVVPELPTAPSGKVRFDEVRQPAAQVSVRGPPYCRLTPPICLATWNDCGFSQLVGMEVIRADDDRSEFSHRGRRSSPTSVRLSTTRFPGRHGYRPSRCSVNQPTAAPDAASKPAT
jgi:hypothetical protein